MKHHHLGIFKNNICASLCFIVSYFNVYIYSYLFKVNTRIYSINININIAQILISEPPIFSVYIITYF